MLHLLLAMAVSSTSIVADASQQPVMYGRDRSCCFPDADIPHRFDGTTGHNVLWKARMPNWSNSGPIVAGGVAYGMAEPWSESYSPWLVAVNADTGRELWRRELDAVAAFPEPERDEARRAAANAWRLRRQMEALWIETAMLVKQHKDRFSGDAPPNDLTNQVATLRQKAVEIGVEFNLPRGDARGGYANSGFRPTHGGPFHVAERRVRELGLGWCQWRSGGTWVGVGYPTPASDGGRVWTVTAHNLWSCHDRAGGLLWQRRFPPAKTADLPETLRKRPGIGEQWHGHLPGEGDTTTAPLLVPMSDGRLILVAQLGMLVRALDASTGAARRFRWVNRQDCCLRQRTLPIPMFLSHRLSC